MLPRQRFQQRAVAGGGTARRGQQGQLFLGQDRRGQIGDGDAVAHHHHAFGDAQQFLEIRGDDHHRHTLIGDVAQDAVDRAACADVDALGRLVKDQHFGVDQQPARHDDLLLHAAGKGQQACVHPVGGQAKLRQKRVHPVLPLPVAQPKAAMAAQMRQHQVLAHAEIGHDVLRAAVFGDKADALPDRVHRPAQRDLAPLQPDGAAVARTQAEQRLHRFGAARTHQPADAQNFAPVDGEADIAHNGLGGEVRHLQHRVARAAAPVEPRRGIDRPQIAPDHVADDVGLGQPRGVEAGGDGAAFTQDGDAVGDGEHLLQPVRDKDQRMALLAQPREDVEQPVHLRRRQRGRGFVKDHQIGVKRQRLGDLDQLALRGGEAPHLLIQRQRMVAPQPGKDVTGAAAHVGKGQAARTAQFGQEDVFQHRQIGREAGFLRHQRDAGIQRLAGGAGRQCAAPVQQLAAVASFAPSRPCTSPARTSRLASDSACVLPNRLATDRATSAGPLSGADIGLLMLVSVERSGTGEAGAGTASLSCRPARPQRRFR